MLCLITLFLAQPEPLREIFFMRGGSIMAVEPRSEKERQVISGLDYDRPLVMSPDGTQLVYWDHSAGHWDLILSSTRGANKRNLTPSLGGGCRSASFAPDGKTLAFMCDSPNGAYLLELQERKPKRLTEFGHRDAPPPWSPNGKNLLVTDLDDSGLTLWLVPLDGKPKKLTLGADPAWLDNDHFVFAAGGEIWSMDAKSLKRTNLTNSEGREMAPSVSPDKKQIACVTESEVRVISSRGAMTRSARASSASQPVWSPNSRYVAYVEGGNLKVLAADGTVKTLGKASAGTLAW